MQSQEMILCVLKEKKKKKPKVHPLDLDSWEIILVLGQQHKTVLLCHVTNHT